MASVTRTELNQQTARVLARVAAGERLTVTDRGRAIAEIAPPASDHLAGLIAAGVVAAPRATGPLPFSALESKIATSIMLDELRADRA